MTIILLDVNDVAPEFTSPNETTVTENAPLNSLVMRIKAVDQDEDRNGYVEYSLRGEDGSSVPFSLGPVDGLLRVSGHLDREVQRNYSLEITARDRGRPPKSTTSKLVVRVLDRNDNPPVFQPRQYSTTVAENSSIGASVLQVRITRKSLLKSFKSLIS